MVVELKKLVELKRLIKNHIVHMVPLVIMLVMYMILEKFRLKVEPKGVWVIVLLLGLVDVQ